MERTKTLAGKGVAQVKEKCTDKVLKIANMAAAGMLIFGGVYRIMHCFSEEGFNFFFLITTVYYWFFAIVFGFSEWPNDENRFKQMINTYFNFLNMQFSKGMSLFFMVMMLCEITDNAEVLLSVIILCIAVCNLIIGWG